MTALRVTQYGEPVLRQKGKPIKNFDEALEALAESMVETMYAEEGIGLAAQQIGQPLQLCVVDVNFQEGPPPFYYQLDGKVPPLDLIMPLVLVNPEVATQGEETEDYEEGCLSFPDIRAIVGRMRRIEVSFQDLQGHPHHLECDGILARVILHEVDHLNGVLFIDHLAPRELKKIETQVKKLKRATRDWLKSQT